MQRQNSLAVFRSFIKRREDGTLDGSGVISRECYLAWLAVRNMTESDFEARKFQRTLSNHIGSVDGRSPFDRDEETAVLLVIREKKRWECFPPHINIGFTGYRSNGFHEKSYNAFKQPIVGLSGGKFEDKQFVANFARTMWDRVHSHVGPIDIPLYVELGMLLRFVVLARTPICSLPLPTDTYAQEICDEFTSFHPKDLIIVADMTAKDYSNGLTLAQNDLSRLYLGDLKEREKHTLPFHPNDTFRVVTAIASAIHQPGEEFYATDVRYSAPSGGANSIVLKFYFTVDPDSYLLMLRATVPA